MNPRQKRQQCRILLAQWNRDKRRKKFIEKLLVKKGVSVIQNTCDIVNFHGVSCILKDFKRLGGGGVGQVWGCDGCAGGMQAFGKVTTTMLLRNELPPFPGTCRHASQMGDTNKLVILPTFTLTIAPKRLFVASESLEYDLRSGGKVMLERTVFQIVQ